MEGSAPAKCGCAFKTKDTKILNIRILFDFLISMVLLPFLQTSWNAGYLAVNGASVRGGINRDVPAGIDPEI